ncbi:hypothetical protein QE364_001827 [Nocardioides zeae]|uniref:Uncharacterized protein n=1 Tax=Nocardioides zeae TaxID=1457234 RepID=A0ACC6IHQ1_9ACTN|nr:hypothetical protein [Nocardioides zeae]MDR6173127.1 hypothetical protein [Nocardioides zeae]MDR6210120.1 hypothetical protein [Nocardioides zeae]
MVPAPPRPLVPAPPSDRWLTSRRAVVAAPAALVAASLLAACDGDRGTPDGVVSATEDGTSADVERVDEALAAIGTAREQAATAAAAHATLAPALAPLLDVHDAHLALLSAAAGTDSPEGSSPDGTDGPASTGPTGATETPADPVLDPAAALAGVRTTETDLATALTDLAVAADSGPLARTLAAMAAAVDQRLLLLARAAA